MSAAVQTAWCDAIVRLLGELGVAGVVVSPGSRSAPLALAVMRQSRVPARMVIDERSAGFFALGWARAAGAPTALICTSGTAPAHYYPALIEAAEAGVPLLVLSADRPGTVQGSAAAQTIDQTRLFGAFAESIELGSPDSADAAARHLARKLAHGVATAWQRPVHFNVPLAKPLEPAPGDAACEALARVTAPSSGSRSARVAPSSDCARAVTLLAKASRPLIMCGPAAGNASVPAPHVEALSVALGAPIVADATSGVHGLSGDLLSAGGALTAAMTPDLIVQFGRESVGRHWLVQLARWRDVPTIGVAERWIDGEARVHQMVCGDVVMTCEVFMQSALRATPPAWRALWTATAEHTANAAAHALAPTGEVTAIANTVAALPKVAQLLVANSLPIRALDWVPRGLAQVQCQRGANGIDGLIAGAAGAAQTGRPTVLLIGDVAFAHDLGSLQLLREVSAPCVVVVIDNAGGQLFAQLPVRAHLDESDFARWFATPPNLDVVAVARAMRLEATSATPDTIGAHITRALDAGPRATVLHVPCDPDGARSFLQRLAAQPV